MRLGRRRAATPGRNPPSRRRRWFRRALLLALAAWLMSIAPVLALRWVDPPTSAFMLARRAEARGAGDSDFRVDYRWVDWERISPQLRIALVAAEDQRFLQHSGFDLDAIREALDERSEGGSRGASTISQQVAKNLFLWQDRSWLRKGMEAYFTALIEALWSKRRILEVYANIAEFGDGIYGAEAAAQHYFGRPAVGLGPVESARLAAVLPSPRRYRVHAPGPQVDRRVQWIAQQARQLGGEAHLAGLD